MAVTYTNEIRKAIIDEYLANNLVVMLIYKPALGITDSPTLTEIEIRKALSMEEASAAEAGNIELNGYKRAVVNLSLTDIKENQDLSLSTTNYEVQFNASGGSIGPITHIVVARGTNLVSANSGNGNNRGNEQGTVIYVEPIINAPRIIEEGLTFKYRLNLSLTTTTI